MEEEILPLVDRYLGKRIRAIVAKYNYDVDLEDEYDQLLLYISKKLRRIWFREKRFTLSEFEKELQNARRMKTHLEVLLSYLISKYASNTRRLYTRFRDWYD